MFEHLKPLVDRLLTELNLTAISAAICTALLASAYLFPAWKSHCLVAAVFSGTLTLFLGIQRLFRYLKDRRPGLTLLPAEIPVATLCLPEFPDILWEVSKRKETPLRDKFGYYGPHRPSMKEYFDLHYLSDCICASCEEPYIIRDQKRRVFLSCPKCRKSLKLEDPKVIQERVW